MLNTPEQSLAFILADRGFDVWIANTRGTRWSNRHITLSATQPVVKPLFILEKKTSPNFVLFYN
jgi:hypothetical protein